MKEILVNFVPFRSGEVKGCQNAWFENLNNVREKALLYKNEHPSKPDMVNIYKFEEGYNEFIYIGTV